MSVELTLLLGAVSVGVAVATFFAGRHTAARSDGAREARSDTRLEVVEKAIEEYRGKFSKVWERVDELRFGAAATQGELREIKNTLVELRADVKKLLERGCDG